MPMASAAGTSPLFIDVVSGITTRPLKCRPAYSLLRRERRE
jgi:hypothetical protein